MKEIFNSTFCEYEFAIKPSRFHASRSTEHIDVICTRNVKQNPKTCNDISKWRSETYFEICEFVITMFNIFNIQIERPSHSSINQSAHHSNRSVQCYHPMGAWGFYLLLFVIIEGQNNNNKAIFRRFTASILPIIRRCTICVRRIWEWTISTCSTTSEWE